MILRSFSIRSYSASTIIRRANRRFALGSSQQDRSLSEKCRDPKDYKRHIGRPDDPPERGKKWTGRTKEVCCENASSTNVTVKPSAGVGITGKSNSWLEENCSRVKSSAGVRNAGKFTSRPEEGSSRATPSAGVAGTSMGTPVGGCSQVRSSGVHNTAGKINWKSSTDCSSRTMVDTLHNPTSSKKMQPPPPSSTDILKVLPSSRVSSSAEDNLKLPSCAGVSRFRCAEDALKVPSSAGVSSFRSAENIPKVPSSAGEALKVPPSAGVSSFRSAENISKVQSSAGVSRRCGAEELVKVPSNVGISSILCASIVPSSAGASNLDSAEDFLMVPTSSGVSSICRAEAAGVSNLPSAGNAERNVNAVHFAGHTNVDQIPQSKTDVTQPDGNSLDQVVGIRGRAYKQEAPLDDKTSAPSKPHVSISVPSKSRLKFARECYDENKRHRVYAFGLTETGALGIYKPNEGRRWRKYMARPLRHQFAEENRVISAEAGYGFTLFYVKSDNPIKLYGCGLNGDFQLGPIDADVVSYPTAIDLQMNSSKTKIVSMSAGRAHSVVATDAEGVFLFGCNTYGQCGRTAGEEESVCTITQIKSFGGDQAVAVDCGQDHTCFVTRAGKVYACGWSAEGQTGQGSTSHVSEPVVVEGDIKSEKIVKVANKCDTVLALSDKGDVFGWGSNEFRQLKDDQDVCQLNSPEHLKVIRDKCGKIVDVAVGSSFCLVLNEEGDVYTWGYGILGGGPELSKATAPTLVPRTLFGANEYNPKAHAVKVYCGLDHMAVLNNMKHVYTWGRNKHGCLGIGNSRDQYFPYKLAISADAVHISCAVDHSIIVTDHQ